jgi:apolipoprotein N-acyltransferase
MAAIDLIRAPAPQTEPPAPQHDRRWSWAWLVLGAALLTFTYFQTVIPVAAWLAPIFLLRFARTHRARVALPVLALVGYGATLIALRGFFPFTDLLVWALGGVALAVPYGADLLAAGRLHGFARTLILPVVDTAISFLFSLDQSSAFGSWGATGYTQVSNLPLAQSASVLGVLGLSFVILWAAPVVNAVWERGFDLRASRAIVVPFVVLLIGMPLYGGARLALLAPSVPTVQMAALAPDRDLDTARESAAATTDRSGAAARDRLTEAHFTPTLDDLFARTRRAARYGARVVAWAEAAGYVFKEDEQAFLDRAANVARDEGIYLEVGMIFILPATGYPSNENRSILFAPDGEILWDYDKSTVVPGDGNALGSGVLPVVDTPFGRLSVAICFDGDFPWLARQAGRADVDILILPVSDWDRPAAVHTDMAVMRAIENGMSILRPARRGISMAIDPQGRTLARSDYFVAEDQTMLAMMPTTGGSALYPIVGDAVGWGAVAGALLAAGVLVVRRRRRPGSTPPR